MNNSTDELVAAKASLLSEHIMHALLADSEDHSNKLENFLSNEYIDSTSNPPTSVSSVEVSSSSGSKDSSAEKRTKSTKHSPTVFVMRELKSMTPKGSHPRTIRAMDHQELFVQPSQQDLNTYDSSVLQAIYMQDIESLRQLGEGSPLQARDEFGESLLHVACRRCFLKVVKFLVLEANLSLWVCDQSGKTPLHLACQSSSPLVEMVDFILSQDQDLLFVADNDDMTPLDYMPKDTWRMWVKHLQKQDLRKIMPSRQVFYQPDSTQSLELPEEVAPLLEGIDRVILEYFSKRKHKQKKKRKSTKGEDSRRHNTKEATEDDTESFRKLKKKLAETILSSVKCDNHQSLSSLNNLLQDLVSLPRETLQETIHSHREGFSKMETADDVPPNRRRCQSDGDVLLDFQEHDAILDLDNHVVARPMNAKIDLLKKLEDLRSQHVKATTAMQIAIEDEREGRRMLRLATTRVLESHEKCEGIAVAIHEVEEQLMFMNRPPPPSQHERTIPRDNFCLSPSPYGTIRTKAAFDSMSPLTYIGTESEDGVSFYGAEMDESKRTQPLTEEEASGSDCLCERLSDPLERQFLSHVRCENQDENCDLHLQLDLAQAEESFQAPVGVERGLERSNSSKRNFGGRLVSKLRRTLSAKNIHQ
jgi:hypothetical protein